MGTKSWRASPSEEHPEGELRARLEPCIPDDWLEAIREETGRLCPYVELAPQNTDAYFIATLRLSEDAQPFLTPVGITFGLRHEWADVRVVWARLTRALQQQNFLKALEEWRERTKTEKKEAPSDGALDE